MASSLDHDSFILSDTHFHLSFVQMQEALQPKKPKKVSFDETQFLRYDRCVLRFYGYWDDRESEDGILHKLVVLFYLADDTIEVKEVLPVNSGRTGKTLLARCKLPKVR